MLSRRFDLVVFDWDGTLMDSTAAIATAIQLACRDVGAPEPDDTVARHVIGLGLHEALRYAAPTLSFDDYPRMIERYRYHYLARHDELVLFEGVAAMVAELYAAEYLLGVATGKSRRALDEVLAKSGLGELFHATRCADECHPKPHPEMLIELMELFGVSPDRTLMIGDTTHDLQMAQSAGTHAVAVSFGAHPASNLRAAGPLACVDTPTELATWLKQHA